MSTYAPEGTITTNRIGTVYIVASQYNSRYTDAMVEAASNRLRELGQNLFIKVVRVPGAFEIPMIANRLALSMPDPLAVIALGVIIRGATAHADLIADAITQRLLKTTVETQVPLIHEVLLVENEQQAEERTLGEKINRGREAAEAAVAMMELSCHLDETLGGF